MIKKAFTGQLTSEHIQDRFGNTEKVTFKFEIFQTVKGVQIPAKTFTGDNKLTVEIKARDWLRAQQDTKIGAHGGPGK